jgi:hypothetical protein
MNFEPTQLLDFLAYGALGISLALAILAYRLLSKEQDKETVRPPILKAIRGYLIFAFTLSLFFGITEFLTHIRELKRPGKQIEEMWQQHFADSPDKNQAQKLARLQDALADYEKYSTLAAKNKELNEALKQCKSDLSELNKGFYNNIMKLRKAIDQDPDGWINITFNPDEKEALFHLLEQLFVSLGEQNTYTGSTDKTIARWKEIKSRWSNRDTHYIFRSDIPELVRIYLNRFYPLESQEAAM